MKKNDIKPLGNIVLVQPEKTATKTESGLYIPDNASERKTQRGKIVAIGDGEKVNVKKGQQVIYREYSGTEIEEGAYILLECKDVLAVIE